VALGLGGVGVELADADDEDPGADVQVDDLRRRAQERGGPPGGAGDPLVARRRRLRQQVDAWVAATTGSSPRGDAVASNAATIASGSASGPSGASRRNVSGAPTTVERLCSAARTRVLLPRATARSGLPEPSSVASSQRPSQELVNG
jgi:hypothetical protein